MSEPISEIIPTPGHRATFRLAFVATATSLLWAESSSWLHEGFLKLGPMLLGQIGLDATAYPWASTVLGLLLAGLGLIVAYAFGIEAARKAFLRSSARVSRNDRAPKSRALVLTLSNLPENPRPDQVDEMRLARMALEEARAATTLAGRNAMIDRLCDPAGPYKGWKWQQPLRLLRHNQSRLQIMVFVLTREAAGQYVGLFYPLLELLAPDVRVLPEPHAAEREANEVDHSDYNAVTAALERAGTTALRKTRGSLRDLCIDITSGTKAYSAAATVKTLNSTAVFSYVETTGNCDVVIYDASVSA